jgi:hypothetical protein
MSGRRFIVFLMVQGEPKGRNKMTNPFTAVIDWLDENADFGAPIGAFVGVAIAIALCFILGA